MWRDSFVLHSQGQSNCDLHLRNIWVQDIFLKQTSTLIIHLGLFNETYKITLSPCPIRIHSLLVYCNSGIFVLALFFLLMIVLLVMMICL